jgi:hypothetical protein
MTMAAARVMECSVLVACLDLAVGLLRPLFKEEVLTAKILAGTARSTVALGTTLGLQASDPRLQHMQPRSFGGPGDVGGAGGGPHDQGRAMGLMDDRSHDPRRGPPPVPGGRFDDPRGQREDSRGFEDRRDDPRKRPHGGGRDGGYDERHKRGRW